MNNILIILSTTIACISYGIMIKSMLKGLARPNRTTRFVVMVANIIQTLALLQSGNNVSVWLTGVFAINNVIIFILSIKFGMGGWDKLDIICLLLSILGLILWKLTSIPEIGLFLAIASDFTCFVPTIIKSYKRPETEEWKFYGLDFIAALFNLFATTNWRISSIIFPVYILFIDGLLMSLIKRELIIKFFNPKK